MSVLLPATLAVLRTVRRPHPRDATFTSMMAAELFEAEYSRGHFKCLPRADGRLVLFDTKAPNAKGEIDTFDGTTDDGKAEAKRALAAIAALAKEKAR